ncbi:MAG: glycosyltransferase family 1 protein [Planctomycetes bacterium]|nr:glycosyltransferase family 1 protein [Planctomycetota bacterium]
MEIPRGNTLALKLLNIIQRYPPALGGSEIYFQKLSEFLASKGHKISVWTSNAINLESFWARNHPCIPCPEEVVNSVKVRRFKLFHIPFQQLILKIIAKIPNRKLQCLTFSHNPIMPGMLKLASRCDETFDAVHAGCFPYAFPIYAAMKLAKIKKIPFLLTPFLHLGNLDDPKNRIRKGYTQPALLMLAKNADALFAQTEFEAQTLEDLGINPRRIHLQGMGVDLPGCTMGNSATPRKLWQINPNDIIVGHLANLSWDKGSTDLLSAMEILWRKGSNVKLVLAGPAMPSFEKAFRRFPFKDKVIRTGPLSPEEKKGFFATLDIFALPSRSDSFGIVLLEAWANGKPCVVYKAGGPGSLVKHESDGLISPCDDINSLATALEKLILDRKLSEQLGATGNSRIANEFLWDKKLQIFENALKSLV